ncbi:MAG: PDZ domain-containing protein [Synergistaceae bacterium]|nr:PDZ domain-containing protein [Synergistaceae bacterium]
MSRFNSFYNNYSSGRNTFRSGAARVSLLSLIFAVVGFFMPLLLGLAAGWFGVIFVEYTLSPKSAELQLNMAANIAAAQIKVDTDNGLNDFLSANPFSVSPFPVATTNVVEQVREVKTEVKNSFAEATLTGTFPAIGAWIQDNLNDKVNFVPVGESFDDYILAEVLYDRAIFQDAEENNVTKFLYLAVETPVSRPMANVPAPRTPQPQANQQVTAAVMGGQEGTIDRELINNLLMNPYDEMKKFRIRPKFEGTESLGIEVQWIQNDSILAKLGVAKNDVIKSVNGIPIKNMGDIANAINSLMNGSRFDVAVTRGNAPIDLSYVVR